MPTRKTPAHRPRQLHEALSTTPFEQWSKLHFIFSYSYVQLFHYLLVELIYVLKQHERKIPLIVDRFVRKTKSFTLLNGKLFICDE